MSKVERYSKESRDFFLTTAYIASSFTNMTLENPENRPKVSSNEQIFSHSFNPFFITKENFPVPCGFFYHCVKAVCIPGFFMSVSLFLSLHINKPWKLQIIQSGSTQWSRDYRIKSILYFRGDSLKTGCIRKQIDAKTKREQKLNDKDDFMCRLIIE